MGLGVEFADWYITDIRAYLLYLPTSSRKQQNSIKVPDVLVAAIKTPYVYALRFEAKAIFNSQHAFYVPGLMLAATH